MDGVTLLCIVLLFKLTSAGQVCDSILQVEISESSISGHMVVDLKQTLGASILPVNNLYLSDDLGYFQLTEGRIMLRKSIDREEYCPVGNKHQVMVNSRCCNGECCIFIGISSKDSLKSKFYVRIKVTDVNDNDPIFPESIYFQELLENTKVNTIINLPVAFDKDEMLYSINNYEIVNVNGTFQRFFKLNVEEVFSEGSITPFKQPTLIVKEVIDREYISLFEFTLIAKDGGNPPKEGKTKIIIKILDENDNEPKFPKTSFKISIKENEGMDADLWSIKVEDQDSENNGRVTINLAPSMNQEIQSIFQISTTRNTAVLRLISRLNYEVTTAYKLNIVAKDHGQPPRSSSAVIDISVLNVNDERPEIMFYYLGRTLNRPFSRIYIDEGSNRDDIICMVKVSDADSPADSLSCRLETEMDYFYLSLIKTNRLFDTKQTYELRSKINFDRETRNIYDISILCSDQDPTFELTQSGKLQVLIRDNNDNPPHFSKTLYYGTVKENRVNEVITVINDKIIATDRDEAENGTVEYYLEDVSDNLRHSLTINKNSAIVTVIMGLDFESVRTISVIIGAKDLGVPSLSSSTKLTINVEDTNDNQIEVESLFYSFEIFENEPIGSFVGFINVTDKDTDQNNKRVIMKIKSTQQDLVPQMIEKVEHMFAIDSDTGRIYTRAILDREKNNQITFTILAHNPNPLDLDLGRLEYNSHYRETVEVPVSVTILNRNDNTPIMVLREKQNVRAVNPEVVFFRQHLSENMLQDNCLSFPYIFVDHDDIDNSKIKTTMRRNEYFTLDMEHGVMCIKKKLPPKGNHRVVIVAEDGDKNDSRSQEFLVNVIVKDDTNFGNERQQSSNKFSEPKSNDSLIRSNSKNFRNNLLYGIIGSIAAALFLLVIVILFGFKKFTSGGRSFENKSSVPDNTQDNPECQNFFEYIPDSKYNDLSYAINKNCQPRSAKYQSELDFRYINAKTIPKYSSAEPMIHEIQFSDYPALKIENYQVIPSHLSSDKNSCYNTLTKPNTQMFQGNIDIGSISPMSPIFVTSQISDQSVKTKKGIKKSIFQSTFV